MVNLLSSQKNVSSSHHVVISINVKPYKRTGEGIYLPSIHLTRIRMKHRSQDPGHNVTVPTNLVIDFIFVLRTPQICWLLKPINQ